MLRHRGKAEITCPSKEVKQRKETKITPINDPTPPLHEVVKPIVFMSLLVGYMPQRFRIPGFLGGLLWFVSLFLHTALDFMSARKLYGYAWASIQILLFINLAMCTYSVRGKVVPWLEKSVYQLDKEHKYLKTFARIRKLFRVIPFFVILFSVAATGLQFFCFYYDGAFSVSFEQPVSKEWETALLVVWFITNVHLLFAFSFFWCVTTCNMYTTGYSMTEYHDMMTTHLKSKDSPVTFRQAVHSFAERGTFLKKSASACKISLSFLVVYSIASLGVNAFYYLYKTRRASYIFCALMPPLCSVYPLCLAAWVTKTYKWYLAVVVKAWAERPESTDEEEESGSDQPRHKGKKKSFARKFTKRVRSAGRKDESDGDKPRRRSIFARAMQLGGGSHSDTEQNPEKENIDKPRRRSLFVRAKPLSTGAYSDTEGYTEKDKQHEKPRRRSLFVRTKPLAGPFSDTEISKEKKKKEKANKPRRQSLFVRGKASASGSYSDTEGYPEDKEKHNEKPRRRSLFVRPISASGVPFFENKGFLSEKKDNLAESPRNKKKFFDTDGITNFTSVSETDMNSDDEERPKSAELKTSTEPKVDSKTSINRPNNEPSGFRLSDVNNPSVKRLDSEAWKSANLRPSNRLKPLSISSISENEDSSGIENDTYLTSKNSQEMAQLKPLNIRPPDSEDEATDDENHPNATDDILRMNRKEILRHDGLSDITRPISEDEATDDENQTNTTDDQPSANRQEILKSDRLLNIRRPTSEDEATDDENSPRVDYEDPKVNRQRAMDQNRLAPSDTRKLSDDEATDDENNPTKTENKPKVNRQRVMELILRGTARAVGRLQHRAKMPKFNFEKYISYLQNVLPTIGFKIMGITVTWDMVSALLFLEVSLLALFMQESIFGNQKANVAL